jgi:ethanolamine utilization protein EutP (predicted NTPase)
LALNKADIAPADDLEAIARYLKQSGEREVVTISAVERHSLKPLVEKIGEMLSRDMGFPSDHEEQAADGRLQTV